MRYSPRVNLVAEKAYVRSATGEVEYVNRLYSMVGVGTDAIQGIAIVIAIVSALSIFISLFNSLRDRKYELALMRVSGGSRIDLFSLITLESMPPKPHWGLRARFSRGRY